MMEQEVKDALFGMYSNMSEAGRRQASRGGSDQGSRSNVTAGTHLDDLSDVICRDLISHGFRSQDVVNGRSEVTLPGWFRRSKDWDILAFHHQHLLAAIELKSINDSFPNNANNRAEEALGEALDADYSIRNGLYEFGAYPPVLGYALVVRDCHESRSIVRMRNEPVYPIDDAFEDATNLDRFKIMCQRMLAERIFQAVWIVYVDPDRGEITEPDPYLTYERFIATIAAQLNIYNA